MGSSTISEHFLPEAALAGAVAVSILKGHLVVGLGLWHRPWYVFCWRLHSHHPESLARGDSSAPETAGWNHSPTQRVDSCCKIGTDTRQQPATSKHHGTAVAGEAHAGEPRPVGLMVGPVEPAAGLPFHFVHGGQRAPFELEAQQERSRKHQHNASMGSLLPPFGDLATLLASDECLLDISP